MTGALKKRQTLDRDAYIGRPPCEDRIALYMPGTHQEARRVAWNSSFSTEKHGLANTLILNFQPPELGDNVFLLF